MTYTLGFDPEERAGDTVIEKDGVKIFIDMKSSMYLNELRLIIPTDLPVRDLYLIILTQ
ncbi:MAG: hypothetical protein R2942_04920 [Ignavibacteria bacterium]